MMTPLDSLIPFMGNAQRRAVIAGMRGEESAYFHTTIGDLASRVAAMPKTYEQDGVADPIVSLHYFTGNADWYITEKDIDHDGAGQVQAYGYADLGFGGEMGYISIGEIVRHGAELDFHFTPRPLSAVRGASITATVEA